MNIYECIYMNVCMFECMYAQVRVSTASSSSSSSPPPQSLDCCRHWFFCWYTQTLCLFVDPTLQVDQVIDLLLLLLVTHQQRAAAAATVSSSLSWRRKIMTMTTMTMTSTLLRSQDLFLVWNGKPLAEHRPWRQYQIPPNATVMVSYRHRGGCWMVSFTVLCTMAVAIVASTCTCGISLLAVPLLLPLLFVLPLFCL